MSEPTAQQILARLDLIAELLATMHSSMPVYRFSKDGTSYTIRYERFDPTEGEPRPSKQEPEE